MTNFEIHSRKLKKTVYFTVADNGGYVWVSFDGGIRRQPCHGGYFYGNTLWANALTLERVARKWYRQYISDWQPVHQVLHDDADDADNRFFYTL